MSFFHPNGTTKAVFLPLHFWRRYCSLQALLIVPLSVNLIDSLLIMWLGETYTIMELIANCVLVTIAIDILYSLFYGLVLVFGLMSPEILWSILYGTAIHRIFKGFPSHDTITFRALDVAYSAIQQWIDDQCEQVLKLAERKRDGLNAQGQVISFIFATIGLLSVVGFDKISNLINVLIEAFNKSYMMSNSSTEILSSNIFSPVLIVSLALLLVYIICSYFAYSYRALRALEVIEIVCSVRVDEYKKHSNIKGRKLTTQELLNQLLNSGYS